MAATDPAENKAALGIVVGRRQQRRRSHDGVHESVVERVAAPNHQPLTCCRQPTIIAA